MIDTDTDVPVDLDVRRVAACRMRSRSDVSPLLAAAVALYVADMELELAETSIDQREPRIFVVEASVGVSSGQSSVKFQEGRTSKRP